MVAQNRTLTDKAIFFVSNNMSNFRLCSCLFTQAWPKTSSFVNKCGLYLLKKRVVLSHHFALNTVNDIFSVKSFTLVDGWLPCLFEASSAPPLGQSIYFLEIILTRYLAFQSHLPIKIFRFSSLWAWFTRVLFLSDLLLRDTPYTAQFVCTE